MDLFIFKFFVNKYLKVETATYLHLPHKASYIQDKASMN